VTEQEQPTRGGSRGPAYGHLRGDTPAERAGQYENDMRNLASRNGFRYTYTIRDNPHSWGVLGSGLPANLRRIFEAAEVVAVITPSLNHLHGFLGNWCEYVAVWTMYPQQCRPHGDDNTPDDGSRQTADDRRVAGGLHPVAFAYMRSDLVRDVNRTLEDMALHANNHGYRLDEALVFADADAGGSGLARLIAEVQQSGARAVVIPSADHLTDTQLVALRGGAYGASADVLARYTNHS